MGVICGKLHNSLYLWYLTIKQDKARQGKTRQDKARQGKTRQDKAKQSINKTKATRHKQDKNDKAKKAPIRKAQPST